MAQVHEKDGIVELADPGSFEGSPLWNDDIAPTRLSQRTWDWRHIASLWVGMAVCVPTYMLASSLIQSGMSWKQAIFTVLLANLLVLIPMVLNAHAGTRYGIPFPVYCRSAFGVLGANIPALMRGMVACGWFGIQTWIGGSALFQMAAAVMPSLNDYGPLGANPVEFGCFLIFWAINIGIVLRGIDSIKILEGIGAPFLLVVGLALLAWAWVQADGFGPMLRQPSQFTSFGEFLKAFAPGLTANVAFWATLSLNIPDFTRFARSQRDQVVGQAVGLPPTMTLFAFIGVAVTSATVVIYGEPIWNPVVLMARAGQGEPLVVFIAMLALSIATLTTNLAANVVSPANDISNLAPRKISFKMGGVITGIIGIMMMPWKLLADPNAYVFTWLGGYGSMLGAIGGVLIAEYWLIRKGELNLPDLYRMDGEYGKWRPTALAALFLGILPCVPGFLTALGVFQASGFFELIYSYSVFVSFGVAALAHMALRPLARPMDLAPALESTSR
ncbi:MAG: NCS1 family nucleobase:cation symporter-1 [Armatimonadetes bacterium]|nr:NCS1 family nucleobase:cation symporter-1 [Armatimonadota bacterium]